MQSPIPQHLRLLSGLAVLSMVVIAGASQTNASASSSESSSKSSSESSSESSTKTVTVREQDRCDPVTFNEALGAGACVPTRRGDLVTFPELLATLNPSDFGHEEWNFSRDEITIKEGDKLRIENRGGEAHSFTMVPKFGGGCVDQLNQPLGLTEVTANCPADFATLDVPGSTREVSGLAAGRYRFMCIIHPWMRATVTVRAE
jgi:plastocyanin